MSNPPAPDGPSDWDDDQPGWQGQKPDWVPPKPGWQAQHPDFHGRREPESYLVWAILCTLLCFPAFGIVSIYYATRVNGLWTDGNYPEAQKASTRAKRWAVAGAITGPVLAVIGAVTYLVLVPGEHSQPTPGVTTTFRHPTRSVTSPVPTVSETGTPPVPATTTSDTTAGDTTTTEVTVTDTP
jgi:hypothetical protein